MLKYPRSDDKWMGCKDNHRCYKSRCPGSIYEARTRFSKCTGENLNIYAQGRSDGETIYNGDVVMLYVGTHKGYVSMPGRFDGDDTKVDFCPGIAPPSYLSYAMCSKYTFRVYRKPY